WICCWRRNAPPIASSGWKPRATWPRWWCEGPGQMTAAPPPDRRLGTVMMVLAWIAGLAVAAQWFAGVEERRRNPNQAPLSLHTGTAVEVRLQLKRGRPIMVNTANGLTESWSTRIDTLQLGDIRLHGVSAGIVPGILGDEVLLGMSALKQLDFTQRGNELILRQHVESKHE